MLFQSLELNDKSLLFAAANKVNIIELIKIEWRLFSTTFHSQRFMKLFTRMVTKMITLFIHASHKIALFNSDNIITPKHLYCAQMKNTFTANIRNARTYSFKSSFHWKSNTKDIIKEQVHTTHPSKKRRRLHSKYKWIRKNEQSRKCES